MKNDQRDCQLLGDLMRANMLPEAWISTPQVREWRELVRYRAKLVGLRSGLKAQAHAVLAKLGVHVPMTDLFGVGGRELLARLCATDRRFHSAFGQSIESLVVLIDAFDHEINELSASIAHVLASHGGYRAIQQIDGVGPVTAAILVAEIGDVTRFASAAHLASWVTIQVSRVGARVFGRVGVCRFGRGVLRERCAWRHGRVESCRSRGVRGDVVGAGRDARV